jgi:hypothetical protein
MANSSVTLTLEEGILVPSQPSVPFVSGNSVSFATSDGSPAYLFFSPAAIAALSPPPSVPYALNGSGAEFTFASSEPGHYSVYFETTPSATPPPFPVSSSTQLLLEVDSSGLSFGGHESNLKT